MAGASGMAGASDTAGQGIPGSARTFPRFVRAAATAYGDAVAVLLEDGERAVESITFREWDERSALIARGLLARGIGKGARIGFIHGNGPGFVVMLAAISRIGAVAVPISTMIRAGEMVRVLRQSDVHGLVMNRSMLGKDYVERILEALPELQGQESGSLRVARAPYLRWIVSTGEDLPSCVAPMTFLTDAAASVDDDLLREIEAEVHTADQMVEIYTSGSMALPKGVRHNHGAVLFRCHTMREMMGYVPGERISCTLPMFWVGGLMVFLMPALEAGSVVVCSERTLNNGRLAMGGVLAEEELAALKGPGPWWGLGMSETLGPYSWGDEFRLPGRPVCAPMDHFGPGFEVRVAGKDDQPVADGAVGEMQVRGYPVAMGLHKTEHADHYTADGYYRTGDLCLVEDRPQGRRIHFVGRDGDMIKVSGSNVSPAEVEMEMQSLDAVHRAYVVGLPDKERGALLVAAVVPRDGAALDFESIQGELRRRLSSYKVPRAFVQLTREEVPLLHSNKLARRDLTRMVAERLGRA
ncbi:class I adenylate-forming enzyme family protein [Novosphingobium sp. CF614]|uniref:class I adenylate-forming enzyme family protein n=1 Tax=Novosphingobium sp. CF614 TaxID=1884364 RepID=UPI000B8456F9|nr:class I adenylate-forming enzyme family protein [Novosphingobium sp. CF614]